MKHYSKNIDKILRKSIIIGGYNFDDLAKILGISPLYVKRCYSTKFSDAHTETLLSIFFKEGIYDGEYFYIQSQSFPVIAYRVRKFLNYTQKNMAKQLNLTYFRIRALEKGNDPLLSELTAYKKLANENNIYLSL